MELPTVKIEQAPSPDLKSEDGEDIMIPEDNDDIYEDPGDLDFSNAQQNVWLSHVPRSLWEDLTSSLADGEELDIGTIRVEGPQNAPTRVSLKLRDAIPQLQHQPKEYNLFRAERNLAKRNRGGSVLVFSEKDLPEHKPRSFAWNNVDEEGKLGQGRSLLFESNKRDQKRKENRGRYQPYARRPIPKQTAIAGTITSDFDCIPVKNKEYYDLEAKRTEALLQVPDRQQATLLHGRYETKVSQIYLSRAEKAAINKQNLIRKQQAKDSRAARVDRTVLTQKLFELFKQYRIWSLRDLKTRVNQPEAFLREILNEIAEMHKMGDWTGKWELKKEFKEGEAAVDGVAPGGPPGEDSEMDRSGMDEDDVKDEFEDVKMES